MDHKSFSQYRTISLIFIQIIVNSIQKNAYDREIKLAYITVQLEFKR